MPQAPPYAGPRRTSAKHQSLRAWKHGQIRKRKRDTVFDDDDNDDDRPCLSLAHDVTSSSTHLSAINRLTAVQANQLRVAGHDPELPLPESPFPHAPASYKNTRLGKRQPLLSDNDERPTGLTPKQLQQHLVALNPPLYPPRLSLAAYIPRTRAMQPLRDSNLQGCHLPDTDTGDDSHWRHRQAHGRFTLLHRCLLQGDHHRASLLWNLILEAGRRTLKMDERAHARWGVDAELHSYAPRTIADSESRPSVTAAADDAFTEEGFEAARLHYERLILENPIQQSSPTATSALTLYPAMFSVWLYEIAHASRIALAAAETSDYGDEYVYTATDLPDSNRVARILAARADELHRARRLEDRLNDILSSPYFDKCAELLHLREMVAVWIGDIIGRIHDIKAMTDGQNLP